MVYEQIIEGYLQAALHGEAGTQYFQLSEHTKGVDAAVNLDYRAKGRNWVASF